MRTQQLLETWPREELRDDSSLDLSLGMSVHRSGTKEDDINGGSNLELFAGPKKKNLLSSGEIGVEDSRCVSFGGTSGFVHPWSLAARQKKTAFEQRQLKTTALPLTRPPSETIRAWASAPPMSAAPVVGWPPVRTCRKNLVSRRPSKPNLGSHEKEAKKPKKTCGLENEEDKAKKFVKVNMDGLAVGRKIDLTAHDGYQSLSDALRKLFHNLIFVKDSSKEGGENGDEKASSDPILLYEDNEGDRMLVGDVPWGMFVGSVKRLYITHSPVEGEVKKGDIDQGTAYLSITTHLIC